MRRWDWIYCLWPGLPWLWLGGSGIGLIAAAAFALLLNFALAATFLWPEFAPAAVVQIAWLGLGLGWVVAAGAALVWFPSRNAAAQASGAGDLFQQVQTEYLQGEWYRAEAGLERLLRRNPRDAEALLLLAALYRRTRRQEQSRQTLRRLERLDAAARWRLEIVREYALLDRMAEAPATELQSEQPAQEEPAAADRVEESAVRPRPKAA